MKKKEEKDRKRQHPNPSILHDTYYYILKPSNSKPFTMWNHTFLFQLHTRDSNSIPQIWKPPPRPQVKSSVLLGVSVRKHRKLKNPRFLGSNRQDQLLSAAGSHESLWIGGTWWQWNLGAAVFLLVREVEKVRTCKGKQHGDTKVNRKKNRRYFSKHQSQNFSASHGEDYGETHCPPVIHEVHGGCRDSFTANERSAHAGKGGCQRKLWPVGDPI